VVTILTLTTFVAVLLFCVTLLRIVWDPKMRIQARIKEIIGHGDDIDDAENALPLYDRIVLPAFKAVTSLYEKYTPGSKISNLTERLETAGLIADFSPEKWIFRQVLVSIVGVLLLFFFLIMGEEPSFFRFLLLVIVWLLGVKVFFDVTISSKTKKRQSEILKALPYSLDLLTLCVEAGLSFSESVIMVVENVSGPLRDEFSQALKEMKMGIPRKDAMMSMAKRCKVKELSNLFMAIIQAETLGVSLARIMKIESGMLRDQLREAFRERAMRVPVKMLFPLIFFIFPTIFVILLGPAAIRILEVFG